jgi:uncharacterized protein
MTVQASHIREQPFTVYPWRYIVLTLGWTWAIWSIAILAGTDFSHPLTLALFAIGGIGPAGAAIYLARKERGRDGPRDLWRRLIEVRRMPGAWYLWILLVILIPHLGMVLIDWLFWGNTAGLRSAGTYLTSPFLVIGALGFMIIAVIPEEIGWRGYGLDPLLHRFNAVVASLILGFVWAVWHLPLYFVPGTFLHDSVGLGTGRYFAINLAIPILTILHTVLYQGTARSIYSAVVFHISWNLAGEAFSPDTRADLIRLVLLLLLTIVIVLYVGHERLARQEQPTHHDPESKKVFARP